MHKVKTLEGWCTEIENLASAEWCVRQEETVVNNRMKVVFSLVCKVCDTIITTVQSLPSTEYVLMQAIDEEQLYERVTGSETGIIHMQLPAHIPQYLMPPLGATAFASATRKLIRLLLDHPDTKNIPELRALSALYKVDFTQFYSIDPTLQSP